MLNLISEPALAAFSKRYSYDVAYMRAMVSISPSAFWKFSLLSVIAAHREAAPLGAYFAAKLVGALAEDCGPCTQLVINMAREAGASDSDIEAVLTYKVAEMSAETSLGFRFADAVVHHRPATSELREDVRSRWGEKAVVDLVFALQVSRVFPMVKMGLGFAGECRSVQVGERTVRREGRVV